MTVLFCTLEEDRELAVRELPEWMFDAGVCSGMELAATARVDCEALGGIRRLLGLVGRGESVIEAQHHSIAGGADEKTAEDQDTAVGTVLGSEPRPGVAAGGPAKSDRAGGTNAAPARSPTRRPRRLDQGGVS